MRIAFYVLLALNLVYLAWAGWIDTPHAPPPRIAQASPALPQLTLVSEQPSTASSAGTPAVESSARTAQSVAEAPDQRVASADRCVSVGPFGDLNKAARAAALLRERGFNPGQRAEQGEAWDGFWVYVGDLKSSAEEAKVVKTLERAGIADARSMPGSQEERRVSVGLFSERSRAEKRAQAVKRLGYPAQITERKQPGTVYWVDIELDSDARAVNTEGLMSGEDPNSSRLEVRLCPASGASSPAMPAKPTGPAPRGARPAATAPDAMARKPA